MSGDLDTERDLTVVVPVHDENVEFAEILDRYGRELDRRRLSHEFVFVLDGTSDALFEKLREELARRRPSGVHARLIKFNLPFGESIALASGFREARGRVVLSLPQYVQTDPADVHKVLDQIDQGADVVVCWRRPRVDPWLNRVQSWFFNSLMRLLTRAKVHDLNCLQRAMRRRVFDEVTVQGDMYRFLPVLAFRAGYAVAEVEVKHLKEEGGGGFFGSLFGFGVYIRRLLDVAALIFLTRFTRKPLRFFGLAGGGIFMVGLTTCVVLLIQFLLGGDSDATRLKNRAWLIFGSLLIVLGVQTFFIGLVAEIVIFTQGRKLRDYKVGRVEEGRGPDDAGEGTGPKKNGSRPDESAILIGAPPRDVRPAGAARAPERAGGAPPRS
jgi:hypothetical protein